MYHLHSTTAEHRKGKHLSYGGRVLIQTRLKDGWALNSIARESYVEELFFEDENRWMSVFTVL